MAPRTTTQPYHPIPSTHPNHTVDPKTGYLVSSSCYEDSFTPLKKKAFLDNYRRNGLRIRRATRSMGLSESTVGHHLRIDPVFKRDFDNLTRDYLELLEHTSRSHALVPHRGMIERIFLLKTLLPDRYGQENARPVTNIEINLDKFLIQRLIDREKVIEAKAIDIQDVRKEESAKNEGLQQ